MSGPRRHIPRALRLKIVLAIYVLGAALMPLGHHDVVCHLKSTTHCTTCVIGSSAEAAADPSGLARFWLNDTGFALSERQDAPLSASLCLSSGRAPPVSL